MNNIKKHRTLFISELGIFGVANIVGIIVGIVKHKFDALFLINLVAILVAFLVYLHFVKAKMKYEYIKSDVTIINERKKVALIAMGFESILFIISIILSLLIY